ncbi:MAG: hypothetical protein JW779_10050 [Candidatus Thorarchaeota archaeon]|nr:hypothetical protein [Candidatus Thorarchaeota archaeon]
MSYDRIKKIFNPVEKISQMKKNFVSLSDIGQTTIMLTNRLLEFTGISETSIGVTGSQLVDLASKKSDIDIVIYGEDVCRGFYDQLANSYNLIPGIKEYSGSLLDKHLKFRWRNLINHRKILREIERKKKLQGIFEGREFFIRLVRFPEDVDEVYGLKKYELLEPCEITGIITDDSDSIFSPCSYQVESLERPNLKRLVSFRGRFTEQVSKGDSVRARGRLERVINNKSGESFDQLVLGESSSDYLMPF